jgi:HTH-type transcriptional regulator / antitoxin HipB
MILKTAADIGALIREQRIRLDLDQAELAKKAGVSRKWIVDMEKGKPGVALELALHTLRVMGIALTTTDAASKPAKSAGVARNSIDLDDVLNSLRRRS